MQCSPGCSFPIDQYLIVCVVDVDYLHFFDIHYQVVIFCTEHFYHHFSVVLGIFCTEHFYHYFGVVLGIFCYSEYPVLVAIFAMVTSVKGLLFSPHHTCLLFLLIYTDEFSNFESGPTSHHLPITSTVSECHASFLDG